jgi:hypothetical protein
LRSDDGATLRVDADLWLCVLDLGVRHGWVPQGLAAPSSSAGQEWDELSYAEAHGQHVEGADARSLADSLGPALDEVSDVEIPMRGKAFGEENTRSLLGKAHAGRTIRWPKVLAAAEILSGAPKTEAKALAQFMTRGGFTLHSGERVASRP